MPKSATDVMHDIILAAVLDGVGALRASSGGLPNTLLRNLNAIHANTTFADLPKEVQDAINASVRSAFNRLLKEGYSVTSGAPAPRPQPHGAGHSREGAARPPRRSPPSGKPAGDRPERRGPRTPGGKPPRGPRPPRSR